ncbi:hypothetical protein N334_07032, partial [Pelecanus crispus]
TFPTEYVKTQLQLDEKANPPRYKGIGDCVKQTVRDHGIRGLIAWPCGLAPVSGPSPEQGKRWLAAFLGHRIPPRLSQDERVVSPQVKFIHDQCSPKPKYRGFFHGVREIIREQGLKGTYQGLTATVLKQGSNQAIRFFVMTSLKNWYKGDNPNKPINPFVTGVFGALAGAASVFGNTPLDVVKTRMQGLEAHKYKSTWDCAYQIMKYEGPLA